MNKTLLVVMSWGGAYEQVKWSWPYYQRSGFDILGSNPEDSTHYWPPTINYAASIGVAGYSSPQLIRRWVKTVEFCLRPDFNTYTDFCLIEYDAVFLRPPPKHPGWLFTHLAGHKLNQGEKANHFYHTPWWFDRAAAAVIIKRGNELIAEGQFELGSPDVFLGRIIEETNLPWTETGTFSVNGRMLDIPDYWNAAIKSVQDGCWFVHGIRTKEQLDALAAQVK